MADDLSGIIREQFGDEPTLSEPIGEQPPDDGYRERFRRIKSCALEISAGEPALDIEEARAILRQAATGYLALPSPTHALVLVAPPGTGKTKISVEIAELAVPEKRRVLYAGPRHDFFLDLMVFSGEHYPWWYEWLPRRKGDPEKNISQTCRWTEQINVWMVRGYPAIEFCKRFCSWDYVKEDCPYHLQRNQPEPIIFGQHQHVTLGHPLKFGLLIGDESPLGAFCRRWIIPDQHICPPGLDPTEPFTEMLHTLANAAEKKVRIDGKELLSLLGGARAVREATEGFEIPIEALAYIPHLRSVYEVEKIPYFHLPALLRLLRREAAAAEEGNDYPTRVALNDCHLVMLLRHKVSAEIPAHVIWSDATANQHLYETMLGRPVEIVAPRIKMLGKIYQVYDRQNGKESLLDKENKPTAKWGQLKTQIDRIKQMRGYQRVGVITFQQLEALLTNYPERGHFYGERGTNRFEGLEALIIAGCPQPDLYTIAATAKMIFWDRMESFAKAGRLPWTVVDVAWQGHGKSYPTSGFWTDPDLNAILWQLREAEIIQCAHRVRPNLQAVDVWLIENLPIDELPPTRLMEIRDIFKAPEGVDCYGWPAVIALANAFESAGKVLLASNLTESLGVTRPTARVYLDKIREGQGDRWDKVEVLTGGRPAIGLRPKRTPIPPGGIPYTRGGLL